MACALIFCAGARAAQRPAGQRSPQPAAAPNLQVSTVSAQGAALSASVSASSATRLEGVLGSIRARDPQAAPGLADQYDTEKQPAIRSWIVRGVATLDGRRGADLARRALQDPHPQVRLAAAEALVNADGEKAVPDLVAALAGEKNAGVRNGIVIWLGGLKSPAVVAALAKILSGDQNSDVRLQAAVQLKRNGSTDAKQAVKNAGKDSDKRVRALANAP
jgi:HEAT repeat protein